MRAPLGTLGEIELDRRGIGLNANGSPAGDGGAVIAFAVDDLDSTVAELA